MTQEKQTGTDTSEPTLQELTILRLDAELKRLREQRDALLKVCQNFGVSKPDSDGFVWLHLHGDGTACKAAFNLGRVERLSVQVAQALEEDRAASVEGAV